MPENTLGGLREELFATVRALRDPNNPLDIARAKAVAQVSGVIIDSAKVEVDFMRVAGVKKGSDFMEIAGEPSDAELDAMASKRLARLEGR